MYGSVVQAVDSRVPMMVGIAFGGKDVASSCWMKSLESSLV